MRVVSFVLLLSSISAATTVGNAAGDLPVVIACMGSGAASPWITHRAEDVASRIFSAIGVQVNWRNGWHGCRGQPSDAIRIEFDSETPLNRFPEALAYARVGDATRRIEVYYDRVEQLVERRMVPAVLGHVLAHEITHVIEGLNRHSDEGVMKAHWSTKDYQNMELKPLTFASEDIALIQSRLGVNNLRLAQDRKP
jgi:hypothetical protein